MGKTSRKERLMAGLAVLALLLWIFGGKYLDATTVALVVLSLMLLTGIVKWEDVTGNRRSFIFDVLQVATSGAHAGGRQSGVRREAIGKGGFSR